MSFKINLYSNDEKYQDITLPITFFDDCYYPKYKVEINKSLRKQIKNLLKEKLQQKQMIPHLLNKIASAVTNIIKNSFKHYQSQRTSHR